MTTGRSPHHRSRFAWAALLALAVSTTPVGAGQVGSFWAITGATLIDGTGAAPVETSVVLGRGDRIVCVGRVADCPVPDEATVVDAAGKWVIPGLIDTHVHLGWAADGSSERAQLIRLAFGTTTVREAGTPGNFERNLARREGASRATSAEPRLVVSALVSQEHIEAYGIRDLAALVRKLVELGADAIKVSQMFTADELGTIIGAAHASGRPVFGHTWDLGRSHLAPALSAGIDGLSHMYTFSEYGERADSDRPPAPRLALWVWTKEQWHYQDDARLQAIVGRIIEQGVWIEPMLVSEKYFTLPYPLHDDVAYLADVTSLEQALNWVKPPAWNARIAQVYERICAFVRQFHTRGGIVVTGTDNLMPGLALLDEVGLLTECGFTPMAALQAATKHAAAALNQPDLGTVESGKLADLVILHGNPLADPANLRRIWRVVKSGVLYDPDVLLAPAKSSYRVRQRWTWVARIGLGAGIVTVIGGLTRAYRRRRARTRR